MKEVADSLKKPWTAPGVVARFFANNIRSRFVSPAVPVQSDDLKPQARQLGSFIRRLHTTVESTLFRYRETVLDRQLVLERVAWTAMEIFAAACALSRWDDDLKRNNHTHDAVARLFIADSLRRAETQLRDMRSNDDQLLRDAARR